MAKVTPELFHVLNDPKLEALLARLYNEAVKQIWPVMWRLLPQLPKMIRGGADWDNKDNAYYEDKYIPIVPAQGAFLYMQACALKAKNIVEFGTSFGISTLYLAKAAKDNGGKVITTEYVPKKAATAQQNFDEAGLADYIQILEGDALQTLKEVEGEIDLVLLDGWPDLVFEVFKLLEPKLKTGAVIMVDDVEGFAPAMQDYLDYVRSPDNGYISSVVKPDKGMEFTIKVK